MNDIIKKIIEKTGRTYIYVKSTYILVPFDFDIPEQKSHFLEIIKEYKRLNRKVIDIATMNFEEEYTYFRIKLND